METNTSKIPLTTLLDSIASGGVLSTVQLATNTSVARRARIVRARTEKTTEHRGPGRPPSAPVDPRLESPRTKAILETAMKRLECKNPREFVMLAKEVLGAEMRVAIDDTVRAKALTLFAAHKNPREVSRRLGISVGSANAIRRALRKERKIAA